MKWPERLGFEKSVAAWFEMKACISRSVNKQIQPLDQNTWLEDVTFAQQFEMIFVLFFTNKWINSTYEASSTCLGQNTPRRKTSRCHKRLSWRGVRKIATKSQSVSGSEAFRSF